MGTKDKYADNHRVTMINDTNKLTFEAPSYDDNDPPNPTLWDSSNYGGGTGEIIANINFDGTTVFNEKIGISRVTKSGQDGGLYVDADSRLRGDIVRFGSSVDSISSIEMYPAAGESVTINGDLEVTGNIIGSIGDDSTGSVIHSSSHISLRANDGSANLPKVTLNSVDEDGDGGGMKIELDSGSSVEAGNANLEIIAASIQGECENESFNCYWGFNRPYQGRARFYVWSDTVGFDYQNQYMADFHNTSTTGGSKRVLRLALRGDADPSSEGGFGGDSANEDYFLRCISGAGFGGEEAGSSVFFIDGDGNTAASFTGQHWVVYKNARSDEYLPSNQHGKIVCSSGTIYSKKSYNEGLPVVEMCTEPNDKRVYGVLHPISDSDMTMKQFTRFNGVFNSISKPSYGGIGLSYSDDSMYYKSRVNSVGEGLVWVTDANGSISNGDYIASSAIAGYGMRQDDDVLHNYTVAKCIEDVDWSSVDTFVAHEGTEYKKYLVACTYHCG